MARLGWRLTASATFLILAGLALHFGLSGWTAKSVTAGIDPRTKLPRPLFDGLCCFECATPLAFIHQPMDASKPSLDRLEFCVVTRDTSGADRGDVVQLP